MRTMLSIHTLLNKYNVSFAKHELVFVKPSRTSRGEMKTHAVYYVRFVRVHDGKITYGEAAPLPGLSIDAVPGFESKLQWCCEALTDGMPVEEMELALFPSIQFAFETALLAMKHEAPFVLFDNDFMKGKGIPINGLVWMNDKDTMLEEALEKVNKGFNCIKFKIGALDFDEECRMLEAFRKKHNAFKAEIRLDANGAFNPGEVMEQLRELRRFEVHSIEQPIKQGQWETMQEVCAKSPVDIALDEELIGVKQEDRERLLSFIKPRYIILKPTLTGGLQQSDQWIAAAQKHHVGWWATSALESSVGLNAIAQWTASYHTSLPQGLGTGSLYHNNISSPLEVRAGMLYFNMQKKWEIPADLYI